MKITKIEAIPLTIGPMIVRVYTDEGIVALRMVGERFAQSSREDFRQAGESAMEQANIVGFGERPQHTT